MYPRRISVSRYSASSGVGAVGYSASETATETVLFKNIPAEIQATRRVGSPDPNVPSDTISLPGFNIFVQPQYLKLGDVTEKDTITDDLGKRYQVIVAYWNVLGYNISASLLEL